MSTRKAMADAWSPAEDSEEVALLAEDGDGDRPQSRPARPSKRRRRTVMAVAAAFTVTGGAVYAFGSSTSVLSTTVDLSPWAALDNTTTAPLASTSSYIFPSSPSRHDVPAPSMTTTSVDALPTPAAALASTKPAASADTLDTRPPVPSNAPAPAKERFIAYLPHSGLHNQRIELQNALLLAHLTDRTLLVPLARLGHPLPWKATPLLQSLWPDQQKSSLTRCQKLLPQLESGKGVHDFACRKYAEYSQVSWEFLVDLENLKVPIRLVDRVDLDREWLTSPSGLNVNASSIHAFDDPDRYSWRFYDDPNDQTKLGNYVHRLDIDVLRDDPADLLEFGSMFGSSRWIMRKPETRALLAGIEASLTFQVPVLDTVADAIEAALGGRENFVGLHLRVGDGGFARVAVKGMQNVFRQLCTRVFKLDAATTERLVVEATAVRQTAPRLEARSEASSTWSFLDHLDSALLHERDEAPMSNASTKSSGLSARQAADAALPCRGELHTDPALLPLNARVYIATDARHPLTEPALAPFRHALPCLSFLSDFRPLVPSLPALDTIRSEQEGVKMAPFLLPMLEAMIAGRGRVVLGTKGSTFSRYVTTVLHNAYWPATSAAKHHARAAH